MHRGSCRSRALRRVTWPIVLVAITVACSEETETVTTAVAPRREDEAHATGLRADRLHADMRSAFSTLGEAAEELLGPNAAGLSLWVSCAWNGQLEPCNCAMKNLGDAAVFGGVLARARAQAGGAGNILSVFAGNVGPLRRTGGTGTGGAIADFHALRVDASMRVLGMINPTIVVPGPTDLRDPATMSALCGSLPGRVLVPVDCGEWEGSTTSVMHATAEGRVCRVRTIALPEVSSPGRAAHKAEDQGWAGVV